MPRVTALSLLAFLVELALFALLAVSGDQLGDGAASSVLLAVVLATGGMLVWARWMAPRSEHRLPFPHRFLAQATLFAVACGLAVSAGITAAGIVMLFAGIAVFAALGDEEQPA